MPFTLPLMAVAIGRHGHVPTSGKPLTLCCVLSPSSTLLLTHCMHTPKQPLLCHMAHPGPALSTLHPTYCSTTPLWTSATTAVPSHTLFIVLHTPLPFIAICRHPYSLIHSPVFYHTQLDATTSRTAHLPRFRYAPLQHQQHHTDTTLPLPH